MLSAITTILTPLINVVGDWFKRKQEITKAKHHTELEIEKNKARLAADRESHNHEWEMESLRRSPGVLKILSFCGWYIPMIVVVFLPDYGLQMFENMKNAPEWYVQGFIVINFAVWGIAVSRDTVSSIVANITNLWQAHREEKKLKKIMEEIKKEN